MRPAGVPPIGASGRASSGAGELPALRRRLPAVQAAVGLVFFGLIARLWFLQIHGGERYAERSADNFVKDVELPAIRGRIRDRAGVVLADNRPSFDVVVTPRFFTAAAEARLVELLALPPDVAKPLAERVARARGPQRFRAVRALEDVTRAQLATIESHRDELPGVAVEAQPHRSYPQGALAAHLLGFLNQVTAEELATRRALGYRPGDAVGRSGLERRWEAYLRGRDGVERVIVDARGQRKTGPGAAELLASAGQPRVDPTPGHDLILTIDARLQRIAEQAFGAQPSGAAVVIEVETGRVLALLSRPAIDPNLLTGHLSLTEEQRINADPLRPRIDKAVRENYYPGSTFKIVPAIAALEERLVAPEETQLCKGYHELGRRSFRCHGAHGPVTLRQALARSCNVFFYRLGERLGLDRMARVAEDLGFGSPTGLAVNGEVGGFIPTRRWYDDRTDEGFRIGYALNTAIGQGSVKVTPLQVAMAYAAIANGGRLYVPQVVRRVETAGGRLVEEFPPRLRRTLAAAPRTLAAIRAGLRDVVWDPKGTAYAARIEGVPVAGKTGTAQVRRLQRGELAGDRWDLGRDHAWFAAYAPVDRPEIAIVVLSEHGGFGAQAAAPIAMRIAQGYLGERTLRPPPAQPPPARRAAAPEVPPAPPATERL